jgi:ribonuclease BN (tRNA processing enzyme)
MYHRDQMRIKWTILGSASGIAEADRAQAGHVLSCDDRLVLFDCGSGVTSSLLRSGFDPNEIYAVFLSHTHPDHISDLPVLIQKLHLIDRQTGLTVYLPSEAVNAIAGYLDTCYLFKEKLRFDLTFEPIESRLTLFDDKFQINPIPNRHLSGNAEVITALDLPNRMECFSFLIEGGSRRILYSADLLTLDDVKDHFANLDLLVIETTHIDLSRLGDLLKKAAIKQVVLTHTGDEEFPAVRRFVKSAVTETEIIIGEDNLVIDI